MANLPVPIPRNWTPGETEVGAYLNSVRDALNFLLNPPVAVLEQATVQSIANSSWTSVALDSSVVDSYGMHSNVTNNTRATAQVAGWYLPLGASAFSINATGERATRFTVNGAGVNATSVTKAAIATGDYTVTPAVSVPVYLNVGDYLEVQAIQLSGAGLNTITGAVTSSLSLYWLHF